MDFDEPRPESHVTPKRNFYSNLFPGFAIIHSCLPWFQFI